MVNKNNQGSRRLIQALAVINHQAHVFPRILVGSGRCLRERIDHNYVSTPGFIDGAGVAKRAKGG